ncbi:uncharacterized protein PG986_004586 [Apiospora aurea]|uniref:Subtilisin-like serine protease n=1 Tax=Apiospora aurea TaxID=335848 RepID=A0ABR1QN10_9PEZI
MDAAVEEHRPKLVPFQTRLLEDASTPAELEALLPALYRIGPDDADLAPPRPEDSAYLEKELGLGRLAKLSSRLWVAGRPIPPRPLHYQRLLGREIVVAEQMDLHLVWATRRIYLKPMPRFLLEPHFWSRHLVCHGHNCSQPITTPCHHPRLWKSALGFLFSYAALICHESDFLLAKEKHLLPEEVAWADWRRFVAEFGPEYIYDHIDKRFHFGELRLSRLNKLQLLTSGFALRLYMPPWDRYGDFFRDNFTWLASATVYIAVVLTAMQVGLATTALTENEAFQSASYGFTIFSILGPLIAIGLILVVFLITFVSNWALAMRLRNRRLSHIAGVNNV